MGDLVYLYNSCIKCRDKGLPESRPVIVREQIDPRFPPPRMGCPQCGFHAYPEEWNKYNPEGVYDEPEPISA